MATDARRKEVYWARYTLADGQLPKLADGPHVGFAADLPDLPAYGAGRRAVPEVLRADPGLQHPNSRTPLTWASSRWRGWQRGSSSWTPRRCTCANPTPRSPAPGSVPCERHMSGAARLPGRA